MNHKIRALRVRCSSPGGESLGVLDTREALRIAQDQGLDLVEISPNADPPVCRIMDYGKFQYDQKRKDRAQRKQQTKHSVKEVKFRPNVEEHDYQTKLGHLREFLADGHKCKLTLMFRGRENAHREIGFALLDRVIKDCEDVSTVDMAPKRLGRMVVGMLSARAGKTKS